MFLISLCNPGEFCPFPNAALMVMVFAQAEEAVGDVAVPVRQLLARHLDVYKRQESTMSLFCCPICGGPLDRGPSAYSCPAGHSFDLAREGYVHLLPANRMHSKMPGDDKGMAAARAAFLSKDYYAPLRDALCSIALELSLIHI